jgi:hypothetical protein
VTRFIDTVVRKKYLLRKSDGKISRIHPTENGKKIQKTIRDCWQNLHLRYADIIGREEGDKLAHTIDEVSYLLQESAIRDERPTKRVVHSR